MNTNTIVKTQQVLKTQKQTTLPEFTEFYDKDKNPIYLGDIVDYYVQTNMIVCKSRNATFVDCYKQNPEIKYGYDLTPFCIRSIDSDGRLTGNEYGFTDGCPITKKETVNGHIILLKVIVGSQAYGTNFPESDIDIKGIYLQNSDEILMGNYKEQINVSDDEVYYEIKRFLDLLSTNNPTILEILNTPEDCILYKNPILNELFENRNKFITLKCKNSFGGYVTQQLSKAKGLDKKMNWESEKFTRKGVLDFCTVSMPPAKGSKSVEFFCEHYGISQSQIGLTNIPNAKDNYQMFVEREDDVNTGWAKGIISEGNNESNTVRLSLTPIEANPVATLIFNQDAYQQHCKKYLEYQEWLKNRNTQRYVDNVGHGQKVDSKNLLHVVRLLDMGIEIAQGKGINVKRHNAEYLKSIRKGLMNLDLLIEESKVKLELMDLEFKNSSLPKEVDPTLVYNILHKIRFSKL